MALQRYVLLFCRNIVKDIAKRCWIDWVLMHFDWLLIMDTMGIYNMYFKMLGYTLLSHCLLHFCHFVIFATLLKWNSVFCALRSILWEMLSVNSKSPRDVWIVDSVNNGILWTVASVKVNWLSAVRFIKKIILKSGMHDAVHNFSQLTDPRLSSSETFKDQLQWSLFMNKTLFQF